MDSSRSKTSKTPTVIDLFSGCGGMSWGLHKAGFKIICGIDNWKIALDTFKLNHPDALVINDDIENIKPPDLMKKLKIRKAELDCLIGGPPCQGFSKNVPAPKRFLEDPRNQLYKDFIKFVENFYPKIVIIENVAEIYNAFNGAVSKEIISSLTKLGYEVNIKVIYMPDYGIPQRRRRCFFFASRTGIKPEFPELTHSKKEKQNLFNSVNKYWSAWHAISDLPKLKDGEGEEKMHYNGPPQNELQKFL